MPASLKNILAEVVRSLILLALDHWFHAFGSLCEEMGNPHKPLCCMPRIPGVFSELTDIITASS